MDSRAIALAVPFFFLLMGIELVALRARGVRGAYRLSDSITSLSCGIGQQVLEPFLKGVALVPYAWLWSHARVVTVPAGAWWAWVLLVLGIDLGYYAFHRASHRVGVLWAVHAVHHQSEEYNLSTALRQPWLESVIGPFFYLPLAVLGFPPLMYLAGVTIDTLYQFWIHTRAVGKLGPVEWVMNTPSHHRVHHGIDPRYVDRNYAGIFIVWDRLFGTYEPEGREPVYGTVKKVETWNPLAANLGPWRDLAAMSRATGRLRDKLRVWVAPPEWRPADLGGPVVVPEPDPTAHPRFDLRPTPGVARYVAVQLAIAVATTAAFLWVEGTSPAWFLAASAATLIATVVAWGGLLEARRWAWPLEGARLAATIGLIAVALAGRVV